MGFHQYKVVLTLDCIPYLYVAVTAPRYKLGAFGVVIGAEDVARVAFEDFTGQTLPQQALFSTKKTDDLSISRMVRTESTSHIRMV